MKKFQKTFAKALAAAVVAFGLTACGNLSKVSDAGTTENPVFPEIKKSGWNHDGTQKGSWTVWDGVRQIEAGMNKTQVYTLLGEPHFAEGLYGVREWDYVLNYREQGKHKVCQYKILFDKDMNVAQQWWLPNGCNGYAVFNLNSDVLFTFDKSELSQEGKTTIAEFASKIKSWNVSNVTVQGHTDHLGSDSYNLALSQRRAEAVKMTLQKAGITAHIEAVGMGESQPVKECASDNGSNAEKTCLQPNRRVTILTVGGGKEMSSTEAGHDGPTPVKNYTQDPKKTSW